MKSKLKRLGSYLSLGGSLTRVILISLLVVSIGPIILISAAFTSSSTKALTTQMEANLQLLVDAKADELNIKLTEVMNSTLIASQHAVVALQQDITEEQLTQRLIRYQPDPRGIVGLDIYYNSQGGENVLGNSLSNVYWYGELNEIANRQIVQTEILDTTFASIKAVNPETQWIYLTTPQGMMRLYPWASNDHYPDSWDPREIIFYTVAEPDTNPTLEAQWTPPYVDFAGAGWMVTLSVPVVLDDGSFLGVMSHDITINSLKEFALNIRVLGDVGYGFLIDPQGNVIAHPDYLEEDASAGTQETTNLLNVGSPEYRMLIERMVAGETGLGSYQSDTDGEQLLVYAPIPAIGWRLGIVVPYSAVVEPATQMRERAILITVLLVVVVTIVAIFLAQLIDKPLQRLVTRVHQVTQERKADRLELNSFKELNRLAQAFNEMSAIVWERETNLKAEVAELRIEIDLSRKQKQLESIVESDFFRQLEIEAERLRNNLKEAPFIAVSHK